LTEPPKEAAVPDSLDWDTWLGIAEMRPYSPAYAPFAWRGFFDFGCGALGDMACHILGAPNMALRLGAPVSAECISQEGKSPFTYPKKSVIRFDFPARGSMPPVKIFWHDGMGGPPPRPAGLDESERLGDLPRRAGAAGRGGGRRQQAAAQDANARLDAEIARRAAQGSNGSLFIGSKGFLTTGTYGEGTRLVPASRMQDFVLPPQFLTRSPGHYRDWIRACKGGEQACSHFGVAGPFTEWILLGVLALRFEGKLEWDSAKMRVTNVPAANELIKPKFRKGWSFT
jgi:hypothetical protein